MNTQHKGYWTIVNGEMYKTVGHDGNEIITEMNKSDVLADYSFVQNRLKKILGQVLTVIDSSIVETKQNKAVKDIIRNYFVDEYMELSSMMVDIETMTESMQEMTDEEILKMSSPSIEEIAGA